MEKSADRVVLEFIELLNKNKPPIPLPQHPNRYVKAGQNALIIFELYKLNRKNIPKNTLFKNRYSNEDLQIAYRNIINDQGANLLPGSPQETELLLTLFRYSMATEAQ